MIGFYMMVASFCIFAIAMAVMIFGALCVAFDADLGKKIAESSIPILVFSIALGFASILFME